jgi:hypothetical protein
LSSDGLFSASASNVSVDSSTWTSLSSDSAAKIGADRRSAIAMLSEGRASIWTTSPPRAMCSSA